MKSVLTEGSTLPGFPQRAVQYCLSQAGIGVKDLKYIVFYDKPLIKFERLMETYIGFAPKGIRSFLAAMPVWLKEKLFLRNLLQKEVMACVPGLEKSQVPEFLFGEHHESHAASAFFASPYQKAAVLCMDGVGEWATTSAWLGEGNTLTPLWEIPFPHSLGLLYTVGSADVITSSERTKGPEKDGWVRLGILGRAFSQATG